MVVGTARALHARCTDKSPPVLTHSRYVKHDVLGAVAVDGDALASGAAVALDTGGVAALKEETVGQGRAGGGCEQHQRQKRSGVEAGHCLVFSCSRTRAGMGDRGRGRGVEAEFTERNKVHARQLVGGELPWQCMAADPRAGCQAQP